MLVIKHEVVDKDNNHLYNHFYWWCIGCNDVHIFANNHSPNYPGPDWEFDNNYESPTVNPSILTNQNYNGEPHPCHVFIKQGMIQYLSDSWHALAGQTVAMVELPDWV